MPGNAFIQFTRQDGGVIAGESLQETHPASKGWLEISDWNWDIEAETNFTKGTGASVGRATPGTLSITHTYDKSSPLIMQNIVRGTHFKKVIINMCKQTGDMNGKPQVYFELIAGAVFVTKVSSKGGEDGGITQDVEFVFKEIALGYKRQTNKGTLEANKPFGWNIAEMNFKTTADVKLIIS